METIIRTVPSGIIDVSTNAQFLRSIESIASFSQRTEKKIEQDFFSLKQFFFESLLKK